MANYKRKRPRTSGGRRTSETCYRKRLGLKPIVPPRWRDVRGGADYGSAEYYERILAFYADRRKFWPDQFNRMSNWPKWHDVINHNRPRRREDAAMSHAVARGKVDPDEALWPLSRRPHIYYW